GLPVASVLAVGLGKGDSAETIRRAAGVAARSLDNVETLVTTLSERDVDSTVQGLVLGGYRFAEFRSAKTAPKDAGLQKVTLLVGDKGRAQKEAMERGAAVAAAVVTARDFVNTPPSHLFPAEFAKRAKALATTEGIEVEVPRRIRKTCKGFGYDRGHRGRG
ncbi:M17 family peptidase N-terminal domain-containing protein, partial [Mycolicibacter hiberniae]|uniref:M17 family peptidase N-terminal domain-containing protein n=1 Tax=Mycolicibacter hiberniae TaxID=29314 RepID=UPI0023DFE996